MNASESKSRLQDTVYKIAVAGLLHDIGKFADGSVIDVPSSLKDREGDFRPKYKERYTHAHALQSAAFFENERVRGFLPPVFSDRHWGSGEPEDIVQNLAACHHNPHTVLQAIVSKADQISSGSDRSEYETIQEQINPRDYISTRLTSIFTSITGAVSQDLIYELTSLEDNNLRPSLSAVNNKEDARAQYRNLFDGFVDRLEGCAYALNNPRLWINLLNAALAEFAWCIPAARAGASKPDVSLYDHSRLVAALAVALFRYHYATDTLTRTAVRSIGDSKKQKFLLVGGDLFGIQNYLFAFHGNVQRHRAKLLRGRSLSVALFAKAVSHKVCRMLGLSDLSVVSDVAGKFLLIAHNSSETQAQLVQIRKEVNAILQREYYGELSFGLFWMPCSEQDLSVAAYKQTYQKFIEQAECERYRASEGLCLGTFAQNYFQDISSYGVCALSGRVPAAPDTQGRNFNPQDSEGNVLPCSQAIRDQCEIGTLSTRDDRVLLVHEQLGQHLAEQCRFVDELAIEFISQDKMDRLPASVIQVYTTVRSERSKFVAPFPNTLSIPRYTADDLDLCEAVSDLEFERFEGDPIQFEDLPLLERESFSDSAGKEGVASLAALKVDVDRLGWIMQHGLAERDYTLSKVNTLSRMLATFFNVRIPSLQCEEAFRLLYTVFAGGDDLFMIGPWQTVLKFARCLQKEFVEFTGGHPNLHFSAGISLHKSHTATSTMAELAEVGLESAKEAGGNRISVFGSVVEWSTFQDFAEIAGKLTAWVDEDILSEGFLYRLGEFADMSEIERSLQKSNWQSSTQLPLEALRWRAMLYYQCTRNIYNSSYREEVLELLVTWLQKYRGAFRIPYSESVYARRS